MKELGGNRSSTEASLVVFSGAGPWWTLVMIVLDFGAKHIMQRGCCTSITIGLVRKSTSTRHATELSHNSIQIWYTGGVRTPLVVVK